MDHRKALADIDDIRNQLAASTTFQGFGPAALTATGGLALLMTLLQATMLAPMAADPIAFFSSWIAVAVVATALIGAEMLVRSRRHHSGLADAMILQAVQQFLPSGAAGAAIAAILLRFAPDAVWMLPGLWQILVGIGIFSAAHSLPKAANLGAAWYFIAGCVVLMLASQSHALSPWAMGIPFAVGQLLMAAVIFLAGGDNDAD
ncbi:MAG: hypothetical protein KAG89_13935 [Fulvimarina manganoxydans]|uniref:hypothetical protein n=1 Tax=Fulvimarina manganoxydans TaxID=937218 RepID=UPI0023546C4E|nr:hypothetical protein [Fulvimarina manganoxydans]MCK5933260.1 hypothetical protein [Fulvimarina manganoxydans]